MEIRNSKDFWDMFFYPVPPFLFCDGNKKMVGSMHVVPFFSAHKTMPSLHNLHVMFINVTLQNVPTFCYNSSYVII